MTPERYTTRDNIYDLYFATTFAYVKDPKITRYNEYDSYRKGTF